MNLRLLLAVGLSLLSLLGVLGLRLAESRRSRPSAPIAWLRNEAQAVSESHRTGMPLLVDAWAEWCAACKLLDGHTWSDMRVQREVREHFVPLRIDFTDERLSTEVPMTAYGVEGLPTVIACRPRDCSAAVAHRVAG